MVDSRSAAASDHEAIAETHQTYDLISAEFAERTERPWPEVVRRVSHLVSVLPAAGVVADVGCGFGRDVALLRAHGLRVLGLDLSIAQLRARNCPGLVQADMRLLPLRAESVDAVWCQAALLHLPRAVVPEVLADFGRVVRSGGALSMSVVEGDGEGFRIASNYGSDRRRWFTLYREPELTALLVAAGFTVHQTGLQRVRGDWLFLYATRR